MSNRLNCGKANRDALSGKIKAVRILRIHRGQMEKFNGHFQFFAVALFAILQIGICNAAEFSIGPNGYGLAISGVIRSGDRIRMLTFLYSQPSNSKINSDVVYLDSSGGDVEEALLIAERLKAHLADTNVEDGALCFSACTIIWASGAQRSLSDSASLGFHRLTLREKELDIRKSQAKTDPEAQKVTAFFKSVGIPALVIEKMNETPPTDIYRVDNDWMFEHKLGLAMSYRPDFLDVAEKQCGATPLARLFKNQSVDQTAYKKWLACAYSVKDANGELGGLEFLKKQSNKISTMKSYIANTKWTTVVHMDSLTGYADKKNQKWDGKVAQLHILTDYKIKLSTYSHLDYQYINCDTGTVANVDGSDTLYCHGKMCSAPVDVGESLSMMSPVKGGVGSFYDLLVKAVCAGR